MNDENNNKDERIPTSKPVGNRDVVAMLQNYLYQHYQAVQVYSEGTIMLSTREVYDALQRVAHSEAITPELVAAWLHEGGYKLVDLGQLRLQWLMELDK